MLADFGAISSWAANVDHSCLLDPGTDGAGAGTTRRVQVGRNTLVERITELQAPTVLGYIIEGLPRRLGRVANRWELCPAGQDRTEVRLTTTVDIADNPVARAAEHILCLTLARHSDVMLTGLAARMVEGGAAR